MKIIFSRKGFDSSYGGVANPILPDGRLLSLPIPYQDSLRTYSDIRFNQTQISDIVTSLTRGKIKPHQSCHLDPDLQYGSLPRLEGWRPIFGQMGSSQSHLQNQGVSEGDLFLFFGWFKQTVWRNGQLHFKPKARDLHAIFGWLQIGEIRRPSQALNEVYPWLREHPHCLSQFFSKKNNTVYIAKSQLELPNLRNTIPGGGVFQQFSSALQLTEEKKSRSHWSLPAWFHPEGKESSLSYHSEPTRWGREDGRTTLTVVSKGQEFVLNTEHYPEAIDWLRQLMNTSMTE